MTTGNLSVSFNSQGSFTQALGLLQFPDFKFIFRDQPNQCTVIEQRGGEETTIGETTTKSTGFLGLGKIETLQFVVGDNQIGIETGFLNRWIHYKGKRIKFFMTIESNSEDDPDDLDNSWDDENEELDDPHHECRVFSLGDSKIEHHDYENHYRVSAVDEEEGILVAFIAFRLWASQYDQSKKQGLPNGL